MTTDTTPTAAPYNPNSAPSVRELRHRAEVPMLAMAATVTVVALVAVVVLLAGGSALPGWASVALIGLIAPVLASLVMIRFMYWKVITNAVEVTPEQLPELHSLFQEQAAKMGMTDTGEGLSRLPRLYVANGNGVMNAYATKCRVSQAYIVIYSDLLDIAYEHGDFSGIRFILSHELGHIKARHVSTWRLAILAVPRFLRLAPSVSRAQEYTADRIGSYYAPEGIPGMLALFGGKHIYRHADIDAYYASIKDHKDGFWLRVVNFLADHAVGFRRMEALRRVEAEGWNVHGKML